METRFLWITLCLLLHLQTFAQKETGVNQLQFDSLSSLITGNTPDTILLAVCKEYLSHTNHDDSLMVTTFAAKGISAAKRLGLKNGALYLAQQSSYYYYNHWYLDTTISINKRVAAEAALLDDIPLQIAAYNLIGESFWWSNHYDSALGYFKTGLSLAKATDDIKWQANITLSLADTYLESSEFTESTTNYKRAGLLFEKLGDQNNAIKCLTRTGRGYVSQMNVKEALKYFQKASSLALKTGNKTRQAEITLWLAEMYRLQNNYTKALHFFDQTIKLFEETGDQYNSVWVYGKILSTYLEIGNYKLAMKAAKNATQVSHETGDESLIADALSLEAKLEYLQGEYANAYAIQKRCLAYFIKQERNFKQTAELRNMGESLQKQDLIIEAIDLYHQAISIARKMDDKLGTAHNHLSLALAFGKLNQVDSADWHFNEAFQLYEKMDSKKVEVIGPYIAAGEGYINRAEIPKALELYEKAFDIALNNRDTLNLGRLYNKIAALYHLKADYSIAHAYQQKALELYQANGNTFGIASTYTSWAMLKIEQGEYEEAISFAQLAIQGYESTDNFCKTSKPLQVIGQSYLHLGQSDSALAFLLKAEQIAGKCSDLVVLTDINHLIGQVYDSMGDRQRAFNYYEEAMLLAQKSRNREVLMKTARTLYPLYEEKGQVAKALEVFKVFHINSDSINKKENSKALIRRELASQHEKARQETALIQQQKEERQRWLIIGIIATCVALMAISLAVYHNYRTKYKANLLLQAQNQEIARQKAVLEALDESKSHFFANISHELRTPLTLISSPLKGLLGDEQSLPAETRHTLELMERNTNQLKGLVNDILDLSKLESNEIKVNEQEVKIHASLNRIFSNYESLANHLGIRYETDLQLLPDERLILDLNKLQKILNNLLSNALKHTANSDSVMLTSFQRGQDLVIEVTDSGTGIPAEDLPYIFDRFYQSSKPKSPMQGGTGIGLALAKELTQLMGGVIAVESQLGVGTTFILTFPYQTTGLASNFSDPYASPEIKDVIRPKNLAPVKAASKSSRVLIVEDHPDMQQFINGLIAPYHQTIVANNGREALNLLEKESVDLIISDVMMPEMDGYSLLQSLKDSDRRSIPVIILTALGDEKHKLQALTTGVDDYLTKPFSPNELLVRVQNLLERNKLRKQWQESEKKHMEANEAASGVGQNVKHNEDLAVKKSDIAWLKQVEQTILDNLKNEDFKLSELAESFFLSERQFQRKIKKITGLSPKKYQQEIAMQLAKRLLEDRKYDNVKAVAITVGFYQTYRFTKSFQERFGKDPREYFETFVE